MSYPNRELSQFASFLRINDSDRKIAITTDVAPFVGIGSTVPTEKLDVLGNIKSSGIVSAIAFYGDGSNLDNVTAVIDGYFISTPSGIWTGASVGIGLNTFSQKLNVDGAVLASRFISNVPSGTPPFQVSSSTLVTNLNAALLNGRAAPIGNIVGTVDSQTLINKTLTSPIISTIINEGATISVPTTNGILVHTGSVGIITSELYGSQSIDNSHIANNAGVAYSKLNLTNSIVNADVAIGAGISYSKLNLGNAIKSSDIDPNNRIQNSKLLNSSISGVSLGSSLNSLIPGNYINGSPYNGSGISTFSVNATTESVANTIVARDAQGNVYGNVFNLNEIRGTGRIQFSSDGGDYSTSFYNPPANIASKLYFYVDGASGIGGGDIFVNGGTDGNWRVFNISKATNRSMGFAMGNDAGTGYDTYFYVWRNPGNGSKNVECPTPGTIFTVNGTKNFKITHPINENKYLTHVSVEGPRADLIYRGKVRLNNGTATVNLDEEYNLIAGTFNALCRNTQVWISNVDGWAQCRGHVNNGVLIIEAREKDANEEVNWLIMAERHDSAMYNPGSDENGRPILETDKEL